MIPGDYDETDEFDVVTRDHDRIAFARSSIGVGRKLDGFAGRLMSWRRRLRFKIAAAFYPEMLLWHRLTVPVDLPSISAGPHTLSAMIRYQAGEQIAVSALQIEAKPSAPTYLDPRLFGSGYTWTGTAHTESGTGESTQITSTRGRLFGKRLKSPKTPKRLKTHEKA